ncbi:unnamed protein product, partial [Ectocarpus fasciculatus]
LGQPAAESGGTRPTPVSAAAAAAAVAASATAVAGTHVATATAAAAARITATVAAEAAAAPVVDVPAGDAAAARGWPCCCRAISKQPTKSLPRSSSSRRLLSPLLSRRQHLLSRCDAFRRWC